jgi:GDP/UDP-N,N'-diacetylbacillosamine 2-epimerase (hydrolysing)
LTDTTIIFTCANADNDNLIINQKIKKFTYKNLNSHFFFSLGQKKYLSCLKYVDAVIGNSSSGILEAPSFKIATINIGNRQDGRVMASSVINTDYKSKAIHETIKKVYSNSFKKILKSSKNPYGNGGATDNIINILLKNKRFSIKKKFNDLGFNENK